MFKSLSLILLFSTVSSFANAAVCGSDIDLQKRGKFHGNHQESKNPLYGKVFRVCSKIFDDMPRFKPVKIKSGTGDYIPKFIEVGDRTSGVMRMHVALSKSCMSPASKEKPTFVLLHGEPHWSFFFRDVFPVLEKAGHCVVAPDYIGFGRSDKPLWIGYHTHTRHVENLIEFLKKTESELGINMDRINFVMQDWGGLFGIRMLTHSHMERYRNSCGSVKAFTTNILQLPITVPDPFFKFLAESAPHVFEFFVGTTIASSKRGVRDPIVRQEGKLCLKEIAPLPAMKLLPEWIGHSFSFMNYDTEISEWVVDTTVTEQSPETAADFLPWEVVNVVTTNPAHKVNYQGDKFCGVKQILKIGERYAFDAPFQTLESKIAPIIFPSLIPSEMDINQREWDKLSSYSGCGIDIHTMHSKYDTVTMGMDKFFWGMEPARGREHVRFDHQGHFLPFDYGEVYAREVLRIIENEQGGLFPQVSTEESIREIPASEIGAAVPIFDRN